jgi:hypothetical protein
VPQHNVSVVTEESARHLKTIVPSLKFNVNEKALRANPNIHEPVYNALRFMEACVYRVSIYNREIRHKSGPAERVDVNQRLKS